MIGAVRKISDRIRGIGDHAITVPPMDGNLLPNSDLEDASVLTELEDPFHVVAVGDKLWASSGADVVQIAPGAAPELARSYPARITAFAAKADGALAVALADGTLELPEGYVGDGLGQAALECVTCMVFFGDMLLLAVGSETNGFAHWSKDLLEHSASGAVWRLLPDGSATKMAGTLAWPAGLCPMPDGSVIVSEASKSRLMQVTDKAAPKRVLGNLPGYPAGIVADGAGGFALTIMAPRNQLVEFILREPTFARDMMQGMAPEHWIAPSLMPPESFLEPLQGGALKQLGIMKPWAPSRSIGLVIRLSEDFVPVASHHSRADGRNHGTTSCAVLDGRLYVVSHGNARILELSLTEDTA